jgi:sec-independent protein translocase protein TatB
MEIVMILLVILIVVGPDKLPEYARKFGRYYREFKKIASGATSEMGKALGLDEDEEIKSLTDELKSMRDDMYSLRKSLNEDADELKEAVASEAKQMKESVDQETGELIADLKAETREISQDVGDSFQDLGEQITQETSELKASLEEDAQQLASDLSESGREIEEGLKQEAEELQKAVEAPPEEPPAAPAATYTIPDISEAPPVPEEPVNEGKPASGPNDSYTEQADEIQPAPDQNDAVPNRPEVDSGQQ